MMISMGLCELHGGHPSRPNFAVARFEVANP